MQLISTDLHLNFQMLTVSDIQQGSFTRIFLQWMGMVACVVFKKRQETGLIQFQFNRGMFSRNDNFCYFCNCVMIGAWIINNGFHEPSRLFFLGWIISASYHRELAWKHRINIQNALQGEYERRNYFCVFSSSN